MKASRYHLVFKETINLWEKRLSTISETTELLLNVQRAWMYLESIFLASEDIQRQLPAEHKLFLEVHHKYRFVTERMQADPTAVRACLVDNLLEDLTAAEDKLDKIQKSLD